MNREDLSSGWSIRRRLVLSFAVAIAAVILFTMVLPARAYAIFNTTTTLHPESGVVLVGDSRVYMLENEVGSGASISAIVGGHYGWKYDPTGDIVGESKKTHVRNAIQQSVYSTGSCRVLIFGTINDSPDVERSGITSYIDALFGFAEDCRGWGAAVTIVSNVPSTSMGVTRYNSLLQSCAAERGMEYLDITGVITSDCYAGDGVHYNSHGNAKLWGFLSDYIADNPVLSEEEKAALAEQERLRAEQEKRERDEMTAKFREEYSDTEATVMAGAFGECAAVSQPAFMVVPSVGDGLSEISGADVAVMAVIVLLCMIAPLIGAKMCGIWEMKRVKRERQAERDRRARGEERNRY